MEDPVDPIATLQGDSTPGLQSGGFFPPLQTARLYSPKKNLRIRPALRHHDSSIRVTLGSRNVIPASEPESAFIFFYL